MKTKLRQCMAALFTYGVVFLASTGCVSNRPTVAPPKSAPAPPIVGGIISYSTIYQELRPLMAEHYEPQLVVMDATFGCIPEADTRRLIAEALSTFDVSYTPEARDCEDLSIELTVILRHLFRRDTGNVPLASTFGIVGGALVGDIEDLKFKSPGYPLFHAMCVVRCQGGKWLLIEVESKQVTELLPTLYEGSFELILGIF